MTEQPPSYPPPPGDGGYPPPDAGYGQGGPQQGAVGALPQSAYTSWITRVGAYLIDSLIPTVISLIGLGIALAIGFGTAECDTTDYNYGSSTQCEVTSVNVGAIIVLIVAGLIAFVFALWNLYRQGKTGSTIGKSVMKFKVVSEKTGEPIGFGMTIVRALAHIVDSAICLIGYLFPLWDQKRQTLADKIMSTVCLPTTT